MLELKFRNELTKGIIKELEAAFTEIREFFLKEHDEEGSHTITTPVSASGGRDVGEIKMWPTTTPPEGWLLCDGSQIDRNQYAVLFGVVGTTFGAGSGSTFNLPDFRGRHPLGKTASGTGATLGATGGQLDHVHSQSNHTHNVTGSTTSNGGQTVGTTSAGGHDHDVDGGSTDGSSGASHSVAAGSDFTVPDHPNHFHGPGTLNTDSAPDHSHDVTIADHDHDVVGVTDSGGGGSNTGAANAPFLAINFIIYAGV